MDDDEKMHDLGESYGKAELAAPASTGKHYPTLYLNDEIPELKDVDVGDEVALQFTGVITHKSVSEREGGKKDVSITVELRKGFACDM